MASSFALGTCYFPEHWPEKMWQDDAARMRDAGLTRVRIGEFCWSRIEPQAGQFSWSWLDRAVDTLANAGLEVMMCTPTATPPKWLIDRSPDILACDAEGRPRRFGSRRHYCFSSEIYRAESERIATLFAERYGQHEAVTQWQIDNEYGCHETVRSYSPAAAVAFRAWLAERYGSVEALNSAWGNVFWSQEYASFTQVDLPNLTVTEPNPSHVLDFYRFSSDQVIAYHKAQADIIRPLSPGRDITHNAMGFYFDFDHFALGREVDVLTWDSYPLGFLDVAPYSDEEKSAYLRQGHPDFAGFHHDLYRACGQGRWAVIEQQPGPVNWAHHNPAPLPGMARLWIHEAAAHGAEALHFFRWRQAPFAQEQMHAGMRRPDDGPAAAFDETCAAAPELARLNARPAVDEPVRIGLYFDYEAQWLFEAQPQGASWSYPQIVLDWYSSMRELGLTVEIIGPDSELETLPLLIIPSMPIIPDGFVARLKEAGTRALVGPRSGSKTASLTIPSELPPGGLQSLLPIKVTASESLPEFAPVSGQWDGEDVRGQHWFEHLVVGDSVDILAKDDLARPLCLTFDRLTYLTTHPDGAFRRTLLQRLADEAGLATTIMPDGVRLTDNGRYRTIVNYSAEERSIPAQLLAEGDESLLGGNITPPAGVTILPKSSTRKA